MSFKWKLNASKENVNIRNKNQSVYGDLYYCKWNI